MLKMALYGFPVGLLFGYCMQRGGFCMNSAFRQLAFERDTRLFKAYALAVIVQALMLALLREPLAIQSVAPPPFWVAALAGGFVFGMGMVLARGCSSGNYYRLGEGLIGAYVVVLAFLLAVLATEVGVLAPLRAALRGPMLPVPPTLDAWWGIAPGWLGLALAGALAIWVARTPPGEASQGRWHWLQTGLALGLVASLAWIASSLTGRHYGLSMIQPTSAWGRWLALGDASTVNWAAFMLLAVPLGSALAAVRAGQFQWRAPYPTRLLQQMAGGALMGLGGSIAGGCNIGHGLSGVAIFSLTSILATFAIMLGCWAGVYLLFSWLKVPR
jgi:uncharacterized membrane protein YedE/YeeE